MPHLPTMPTLCNYGKTGMDQLPDRDVLILLMVHILLECILVFILFPLPDIPVGGTVTPLWHEHKH